MVGYVLTKYWGVAANSDYSVNIHSIIITI